jgi:hypothetical protein
MRHESGVLTGPLAVWDGIEFSGISPHAITVQKGGILRLTGICSGNLVVEQGGRAIIVGIVSGVVVNRGFLEIYGTLQNEVLNDGGSVRVFSGSVIAGRRQP